MTLGGERHQIAPRPNETLIQLAERAGLKPRDGTPIVIRDGKQKARSQTSEQPIMSVEHLQSQSIGYPEARLVQKSKLFRHPKHILQ